MRELRCARIRSFFDIDLICATFRSLIYTFISFVSMLIPIFSNAVDPHQNHFPGDSGCPVSLAVYIYSLVPLRNSTWMWHDRVVLVLPRIRLYIAGSIIGALLEYDAHPGALFWLTKGQTALILKGAQCSVSTDRNT